MNYIIGVDCGGTKTEAVAYDSQTGQEIAKVIGGFGNIVVDYEVGISNIKNVVLNLFKKVEKNKCLELVFGIAGIDTGGLKEKVLTDLKEIYAGRIVLINDGQLAHYAILKGKDGITLTAGTGSVVLGLKGDVWYRVGGWGHLFGDKGSAYWIAKQAVIKSLEEHDDNLLPSEMTLSIFTYFQVKDVFELTKKLYQLSKGEVATITQIVAKLAAENNKDACLILNQAGDDLARQVVQMTKKFPLMSGQEVFEIGLNGGVIEKNENVLQSFKKHLAINDLMYHILKKEGSCAKGAYYLYKRNGKKV